MTHRALFALVWLSCVWFGSWALNPNNAVRLFAAMSLVEGQQGRIDAYRDLTIDKALFDGHFYLDKAPGMTLLALPAVAIADAVDPAPPVIPASIYDPGFEDYMTIRLRLAVALVSAVLVAGAAVALFDLGERLTGDAAAGLFASLGFALGTPVWGWSTTLFGHAPVASLLVIAVWAAWRGPGFAGVAGAALGLTVLIEFQAVLPGLAIASWAAWRWRRAVPIAIAAIAGAATLLVPFVAYNLIAFGTLFRLGYSGVVGFAGMQQGVFGLTWPRPGVLVELLVGPRRGLLWVAPVLLLAPPGLWLLGRRDRGLAMGLASAALIVLLVNAAYVYWDGGHSTGPRHSVPAFGLLAIGLAPAWAALRHGWQRLAAGASLALSIAINLMIAAANITAPDSYPFPLADPILTDWQAGNLRTLPGDLFGWTAYAGVALYLALALPLAALVLARVRRSAMGAPAA